MYACTLAGLVDYNYSEAPLCVAEAELEAQTALLSKYAWIFHPIWSLPHTTITTVMSASTSVEVMSSKTRKRRSAEAAEAGSGEAGKSPKQAPLPALVHPEPETETPGPSTGRKKRRSAGSSDPKATSNASSGDAMVEGKEDKQEKEKDKENKKHKPKSKGRAVKSPGEGKVAVDGPGGRKRRPGRGPPLRRILRPTTKWKSTRPGLGGHPQGGKIFRSWRGSPSRPVKEERGKSRRRREFGDTGGREKLLRGLG